jgi:Na+/melibiose symporter-like transporter
MNIPPATKFTLGRIGLFVAVFVVLLLVPMPGGTDARLFIRLMLAAVISAIASWFLLARWRNEMASTIERSMGRRREEKDRLRAALAGEDDANQV